MDTDIEQFYNSDLPNRLNLAGMTDANGHTSILTGSLPFGQLFVPRHIDLAGANLYWWLDPFDDYKQNPASDVGALNDFVRIKTPDDILRFARRYGPLGLCKHGLPPMHRGSRYRDEFINGNLVGVTDTGEWNPAGRERGWCPPSGNEPIEKWLHYSKLALSYINGAAVLKIDTGKSMKGIRQIFLQDGVNEWLDDAGIRLELNWSGSEPVLTLIGGGVFGALGVQLLSAVTANNLSICSGCRIPYLRKGRKPQSGRRNFCPECGDDVANKLRVREWREKNQKEGKNN